MDGLVPGHPQQLEAEGKFPPYGPNPVLGLLLLCKGAIPSTSGMPRLPSCAAPRIPLSEPEVVHAFARRFSCDLQVLEGGGALFHTPQQLAVLSGLAVTSYRASSPKGKGHLFLRVPFAAPRPSCLLLHEMKTIFEENVNFSTLVLTVLNPGGILKAYQGKGARKVPWQAISIVNRRNEVCCLASLEKTCLMIGLNPPLKNLFGERNPLYGKHAKNLMKTDVRETDSSYELAIDLPGFKKEDIQAQLKNGYLTISASKGLDKDETDKEGRYIRQERYTGQCCAPSMWGRHLPRRDPRQI